jgi:hypothetical protein
MVRVIVVLFYEGKSTMVHHSTHTSNPSTTGTIPKKAISTTAHPKLIKDQALAGINQKRTVENM